MKEAIAAIILGISMAVFLISIGITIDNLEKFFKDKPCVCEQETITYFPPQEE